MGYTTAKTWYEDKYVGCLDPMDAFKKGIPITAIGCWVWGEASTDAERFKQRLIDNNFSRFMGLRIAKKDRIYETAR